MLDVLGWVHTAGDRMLAVRSRGRDRLYLPGGKREPGEDDWTALSREVHEELGVRLDQVSVRELGAVEAVAHDQPAGTMVRMICFTGAFHGDIRPAGEIDSVHFVGADQRDLLAPACLRAFDLASSHGLLRP